MKNQDRRRSDELVLASIGRPNAVAPEAPAEGQSLPRRGGGATHLAREQAVFKESCCGEEEEEEEEESVFPGLGGFDVVVIMVLRKQLAVPSAERGGGDSRDNSEGRIQRPH